ncbi:unnamed protein product [Meganyctiphanes norvegica]|uniref:Sulfotransferase domain-containing protein n=1 Tax=Meganyctiphanes norvegica TaxID=48144 RepID=A0AAV2RTL6_MEGNR
MSHTYPWSIHTIEDAMQKKVRQRFLGLSQGLVEVKGPGYIAPIQYANFAHNYYNFRFFPDDVVIMSHPKCGTTWMQEIIWTMRNNVDVHKAKTTPMKFRAPFLDMDFLKPAHLDYDSELLSQFTARHPDLDPMKEGIYIDHLVNTPRPRTMNTHLTFDLLNPDLINTAKIVYVSRNPRDACVSYFHHQRLIRVSEFIGDFEEFVEYWCQDLIGQGPFWAHVEQAWSKKDHPNVLFIFYEDLKEDILTQLQRLNAFLETNLTEDQLLKVAQHTTFESMKNSSTINNTAGAVSAGFFKANEGDFVRKGITGDWQNYFTPEIEKNIEAWMKKWNPISKQVPFKYILND